MVALLVTCDCSRMSTYQTTSDEDTRLLSTNEKKQDLGNHNGNESGEPTSCSTGGVMTFVIGLVAGTFSAIICKVRI